MSKVRATLAIAAVLSLTVPVLATERHAIADTPVTMSLPDGFSALPDGHVLSTADATAVVIVSQLADSVFFSIKQTGTSDLPTIGGLPAGSTVETPIVGGRSYYLTSGPISVGGRPSHLWIAVTGPNPTVSVEFVQVDGAKVPLFDRDAVFGILGTVELGPPVGFEQHTRYLGFAITPKAPFVGSAVETGRDALLAASPQHPGAPVLLISVEPIDTNFASLEAVADKSLESRLVSSVRETDEQPWMTNGEKGLRRTGTGTLPDGSSVAFVQHVAFVDSRVFSLSAFGAPDQMTPLVPTIDEIVASLTVLPSSSPEPSK